MILNKSEHVIDLNLKPIAKYENAIESYIEDLYVIHLAAKLNPKRIRKLCKIAEQKYANKKDKLVFKAIRKSDNPVALLATYQHKFDKVLEAQIREEKALCLKRK